MNILLTAFRGTSSERLIQQFDARFDKLILPNDKSRSVDHLIRALESKEYRSILSLGQKPVIKNKVCIELCGQMGRTTCQTSFDVPRLAEAMAANGIAARLSCRAGTSFCNHLYAHGLQYIEQNSSATDMVFLHIPFEKNLSDFHTFSEKIQRAIDQFFADCNYSPG